MERLLSHVRQRSSLLFHISNQSRQLSSYKPNSLDLKARIVGRKTLRALLDLVDELNATNSSDKQNSTVPPLVVDTTNVSLNEPNPQFPFPGRIGPYPESLSRTTHRPPPPKLDPRRYGLDGKLLLNELLTMSLPNDHQKDSVTQLMGTHMILTSPANKSQFVSDLFSNKNLEVRAHDCPALLRYELHKLFLNYNVLMQPLTALTIILKTDNDMSTWSEATDNERTELTDQFVKLAHEMCAYLGTKQYWADFIDPTSGRPYYGPHTSDAMFETDERFRYFGINIVDLGCCRVVEHAQHGTHVFVGCIFTSALKTDSNVQHLLKEFTPPAKSIKKQNSRTTNSDSTLSAAMPSNNISTTASSTTTTVENDSDSDRPVNC